MSKEPRKVTLMYRAVNPTTKAVTITSDRLHAIRSGKITRIYRSAKQAVPTMTACEVPKDVAPWELYSELEAMEGYNAKDPKSTTERLEFQLHELGLLGEILLKWYALGLLWDKQIVIVPSSLVPKKEKSFETGATEGGDA